MNIRKLPWAGILVQVHDKTFAIDPLYHFPAKFGRSHEPFVPLNEFGDVDAVFITHHHGDHFDPEAIAEFYGDEIPVYMPSDSLKFVNGTRLKNVNGVNVGQSVALGSCSVTASHAVDGVGDPQVSWIIAGAGKKMIHCGDTLWHGYWWSIAREYGPFDAACLPVNGAVVEFPGQKPSGEPITLTPEQAVAAANVLEAKVLLPIHHRAIHHPPLYRETPDIVDRLHAAIHGDIALAVLKTNESITL